MTRVTSPSPQLSPQATSSPLEWLDPVLREKVSAYQRISVVGLGYVGLPTALLFAQKGFTVTGVDINPNVVAMIEGGTIRTHYPELSPWSDSPAIDRARAEGRFVASTTASPADVFIITVPTPVQAESHRCDLTAVKGATEAVARVLQPGNLVILESTVPPGTTRGVVKSILEKTGLKAGKDFYLCFCPERVLPGNTIHELVNNHRVLGGYTPDSALLAQAILSQVIDGEIFLTDDKSAEFCKLAENTYRDVNIALANELSTIADELGIDLKAILPLINKHPRVNVLMPGIGVGGHCIAVDPWFFVEVSPWKTELIRTSREVNNRMPAYRVQQIADAVKEIENPKICCVGLTYKPDVADTRESPAMVMVALLKERGFEVVTYDPLLPAYENTTLLQAATGCDYLAILVNHETVKHQLAANLQAVLDAMRTPTIRVF